MAAVNVMIVMGQNLNVRKEMKALKDIEVEWFYSVEEATSYRNITYLFAIRSYANISVS